ncbi:hypothetical protein TUBRATIS_25610, partial [Tubulinosema ratisbonensis]
MIFDKKMFLSKNSYQRKLSPQMFCMQIMFKISLVFSSLYTLKEREKNTIDCQNLDFIRNHIKKLCFETDSVEFIAQKTSKVLLKYFNDELLEILLNASKYVYCIETKRYTFVNGILRYIWLSNNINILKAFIVSEILYANRRYFLNIYRVLNVYFPEHHRKDKFFRTFFETSEIDVSEFFYFFIREYFLEENELKIKNENKTTNMQKTPLDIYKTHLIAIKIQYKPPLDTNYYTYYKGYNNIMSRFNLKNSLISLNTLLFFINENILASVDFKYLMHFCKELIIIKHLNLQLKSHPTSMKALHFILTIQILSYRCVVILFFKRIKNLFMKKYIPIYKLRALYNLRTRFLLIIHSLLTDKASYVFDKQCEENINVILQAIFLKINNMEINNEIKMKI